MFYALFCEREAGCVVVYMVQYCWLIHKRWRLKGVLCTYKNVDHSRGAFCVHVVCDCQLVSPPSANLYVRIIQEQNHVGKKRGDDNRFLLLAFKITKIEISGFSHLSKGTSGLKQKCTQTPTSFLGTVFLGLSPDVIHFVPRVSSKNLQMEVSDWLLKNFNQWESGF